MTLIERTCPPRNNPEITYIEKFVVFINNRKPRTITGTFKSSKFSPNDEKKIQMCPAAKKSCGAFVIKNPVQDECS